MIAPESTSIDKSLWNIFFTSKKRVEEKCSAMMRVCAASFVLLGQSSPMVLGRTITTLLLIFTSHAALQLVIKLMTCDQDIDEL